MLWLKWRWGNVVCKSDINTHKIIVGFILDGLIVLNCHIITNNHDKRYGCFCEYGLQYRFEYVVTKQLSVILSGRV